VLLLAEVGVRVASAKLGDPLVWYSRSAQNKVNALDASAQERAEAVFVGSSAVAASLDPSVYRSECGARAYNAATNGAVPSMNDDWLERVIEPKLHPKIVVLGISPRDLDVSSSATSDLYFSSAAVRDDIGGRIDRWASRWSYLVRYRNTLRSPRVLKTRYQELNGTATDQWNYDADGFEPSSDPNGTDTTEQTNDPGMRLDRSEVRALERMVRRLQDEGATPILAQMAYSDGWSTTPRATKLAAETESAMESIARRTGATLLDFRSISDRDQFVDLVHVNASGSAAESRLLVEGLRTAGAACER
jgi:hypothetical protein